MENLHANYAALAEAGTHSAAMAADRAGAAMANNVSAFANAMAAAHALDMSAANAAVAPAQTQSRSI